MGGDSVETRNRDRLRKVKEEFYGRCLPQRKRHYFGRDTGWAGGMGQPRIHYCIWCGKYNPKWEPKFWEEELGDKNGD